MTSTARCHAIDGGAGDLPARLCPADIHAPKMVSRTAGPFEIPAEKRTTVQISYRIDEEPCLVGAI